MKVAFITANGLPVTAEGGGNDAGLLLANRQTPIAIWETFTVVRHSDGSYSFQSNRDDGTWGRFICAELGGGSALVCNRAFGDDPDPDIPEHLRTAIGPWERHWILGDLRDGAAIQIQTWDQAHFWTLTNRPDSPLDATALNPGDAQTFRVKVLEGGLQPGIARRGLVRRQGRAVIDDTGPFSPLGQTFMWGVFGAEHEPDRFTQTINWLAQFKLDYIRQLGETRWEGRSINPDSPGYQKALAHAIDYPYQQGMRTQLSIIGDRPRDPFDLLNKVLEVIESDGRIEKIAYLEMCNERHRGTGGHADKASWDTLEEMCRRTKARVPNLVALSCPDPSTDGKSYSRLEARMRRCGAEIGPLHLPRKDGDGKWRIVRQPYDCKEIDPLSANAEGAGIQSSVNTLDTPLHHSCYRWTTHQMGGAFHTIHIGQAVTGTADPTHGRPMNLWEVPRIEQVLRACRGLDTILPVGVENWAKSNNWWKAPLTPHPMPTQLFWEGNDPEGVNKNYAAVQGGSFNIGLLGVKRRCEMRAKNACLVVVFDPETQQEVRRVELSPNQTWAVDGRDDGQTAYLLVGTNR